MYFIVAYREKNWTTTFPTNKYSFSEHLKYVGDWVRTSPLNIKERKKFIDAAYDWAFHKRWRVECTSYVMGHGLWEVECELVAKEPIRNYT